jgi:hypothetical protein
MSDSEILVGDRGASRVLIQVHGRIDASSLDYWGGNWLESTIEVAAGAFVGSFEAKLHAGDFDRFHERVRALYEALDGVADFDTVEDRLEVRLTGDGRGRIVVEGAARDLSRRNELKFGFEIDQTYLPTIVRSVEDVLTRYPVMGSKS